VQAHEKSIWTRYAGRQPTRWADRLMVQRVKGNGSYAPLGVGYFRDDAIIEAGPDAELLFVRGLAFCAESMSDGYITDLQLTHHVGAGLRPSSVKKRAETLVKVGLWTRISGGYLVKSWLKWNVTADDIGRRLKTDRERKAKKDGGSEPPTPSPAEQIPTGIQSESDPQGTAGYDTAPHITSLVGNVGGEGYVSSAPDQTPTPPCSIHPNGPDHDAPCRRCKAWREDIEARQQQDELGRQRAKQAAAKARDNCQRCAGSGWLLDTDPAIKCTHERSATA
jgi:hypothetical protein